MSLKSAVVQSAEIWKQQHRGCRETAACWQVTLPSWVREVASTCYGTHLLATFLLGVQGSLQ